MAADAARRTGSTVRRATPVWAACQAVPEGACRARGGTAATHDAHE